ncbi:NAD(P)-binding protein [Hyaloscypha variabilis F]|uniref:NAD(P)-binding protein n=1 Tax=Hyaloscypha variabilis (strain UAMH 11265 / GT02V1 / F) TaxID=1149755 RepID=A0A2J6S5N8_HYAVF|nr:NAD(P)-binding protein [Hyaloscypha variabilis F]
MEMQSRTVLITGCSPGGIGYSLAREFHSRGFRVFGTARDRKALEILRENGIDAMELEITSDASIQHLKAQIEQITGGSLDILINNVGVSCTVPCLDLTLRDIKTVFEINLFGTMRMVQVFAPLLIKSAGLIVNIGSVAGIVPYVFGGAYNASKAALHSYSDVLKIEMAPLNVRVVTVITGGVRSNISQKKKSLPEDSLYWPIHEDYENRQGNSQHSAMRSEEYARKVVDDLIHPRVTGWLWHGNKAHLVRILYWILPFSFWTGYFSRKFGLYRLKLWWEQNHGNK